MMTELPVWAALLASALLVCGGLLCLLGAIGLLKMPTFYMRMHSPSMGNTLGTGCILIASIVISSAMAGRPILHELMITLFMVMTAPVSAMMIMRAAIYRAGVHEARRARQSPED